MNARTAILVGLAALALAGCSRTYEIHDGPAGTMLIDSRTGKTWIFENTESGPVWRFMGDPNAAYEPSNSSPAASGAPSR